MDQSIGDGCQPFGHKICGRKCNKGNQRYPKSQASITKEEKRKQKDVAIANEQFLEAARLKKQLDTLDQELSDVEAKAVP